MGKHPDKALSTIGIRALSKPGRYADGNGLYLTVDPSGAKRWVLRTVVHGRRRDIGLGGLRLVTLAEAREKAVQYRKIARQGGDPLAERRKDRQRVPSFEEAARSVHHDRSAAWRNSKHAAQWLSTLSQYAFPIIGSRRVDQIETPDVLRVLSPIWLTKPETARRVRQRIGTVLDWAKAAGFRSGDNPVEGVTLGLPKQPDWAGHHAALAHGEVPSFLARLQQTRISEPAKLAFEFLILTATRTNEVLGARWSEIDLEGATWTIPAERTKISRPHRVPLSPRALEVLRHARELSADATVAFPGNRGDKPMSNMVFLMALRRMGVNATAHGFRSAFRNWATECTSYSHEVSEMALAHTIKSKTEAAYRRGDLFEKRRELMSDWSNFVRSGQNGV